MPSSTAVKAGAVCSCPSEDPDAAERFGDEQTAVAAERGIRRLIQRFGQLVDAEPDAILCRIDFTACHSPSEPSPRSARLIR